MKISAYIAVLALVLGLSSSSYAKEVCKSTPVILKCANGKTMQTTTDNNGKFEFKDIDDDCDSYSISCGTGKTACTFQKIVIESASRHDVKSPRDVATGQSSGKRQHKPFKNQVVTSTGDLDGDGSPDLVTFTLSSNGNNIQGMAINEKGLPGNKKPKSNK